MRPKVYVETSVIGAYFEEREDVVSTAQRHWSRLWWDEIKSEYDVVVSEAVINELANPNYPYSENAVALVEDIQHVESVGEVYDIINIYVTRKLMPRDILGDALHLALASYHKCDYLLTWNCKHLANPNKFQHIRIVNTALGLYVPIITTPNQLIGDPND
jgi:predicted nucleic acid-binding protein